MAENMCNTSHTAGGWCFYYFMARVEVIYTGNY